MKSRTLIIIFSAVIFLCAAVQLLISCSLQESSVAAVYKDGRLIEKIDLSSVKSEREIVLSDKDGENVILVSKGKISVKSSDCKDQICVKHGFLSENGAPIICLPHRVVIKWEADGAYDARTGDKG